MPRRLCLASEEAAVWLKKSKRFITFLLCVVCFTAGLYTGQNREQNKLLAILEADAKAWERNQYGARLSAEETATALFDALHSEHVSPNPTPKHTAPTLNLLAAAVDISTPKPTANPTARPAVTPMPTVNTAEVRQQYESVRASWSTTPKPTTKPMHTARPYSDRVHYVTARPATATPKPTAKPPVTPTPRPADTSSAVFWLEDALSTKITAWVTGDSANVRRGASTSYGVVEKLYYGEKLYITSKTASNGWYKVQTQSGNTGYVSAKLISTSQPTARNSSGGSTSGGSSSQQSRTVYVSRTGECYHSYAGCSDMNNPIAMTEAEAIARGRRRCKKCW